MKREFLGDGPDAFKWDYHDWLTSELRIPRLTVALMLTADGSGYGNTNAEDFPARTSVLRFCRELRRERDIERITDLPKFTGGAYELALHRGGERPVVRSEYFSGFDEALDQLVFIDPDTGFEPSKCEECHVAYRDVSRVLEQLNDNSIISVFQYQRRSLSATISPASGRGLAIATRPRCIGGRSCS